MPTAPTPITPPGNSPTPSAPTTVTPSSGTQNAWGTPLGHWTVAGFTADAANLNDDWTPIDPSGATQTEQFSQPGTSDANYLGYVTDRWQITASSGVTTSEVKAELVTADSTDPTGTYTGTGDQVGDSPTVGKKAPVALTV